MGKQGQFGTSLLQDSNRGPIAQFGRPGDADRQSADAAPVAGCLWDMGSGEVIARFETLFADSERDCLAGETFGDMAWRDQPVEREWITAMGAFPSPAADGHDLGSVVTGAVSDANAVAVLDLSRGSGYRAEESRVGFVVAELAVAYAAGSVLASVAALVTMVTL